MQRINSLKNIVIVNKNPDWFLNHGVDINSETIKNHVKYFSNASGLLNYLEELRKTERYDEFPDYVLIDMQLPDMNASRFFDSFEHLVKRDKSPEVFILAESPNKKNRDIAMQYSFVSAYLEKPIPEDLLEVLIGERGVE
ncbi:hypothetical protein ACUNWD_05550 [Sunxiuqinia sp. A32]|uniref:hypothetical protein n=1 Tax=Sunxiuqinia sp. A32 TaxID=3461496 RepID=UPI004045453D